MAGFETIYPLRFADDGTPTPFPTIYWLTDDDLDRRLAELERLGQIKTLEQRIASDAELRRRVHADHEAYRDARWAILSAHDRHIVESSPSLSRSFRGGVGGTADFDRVKCLQAHYAHHLARLEQGGTASGRVIAAWLKA
ncbi:MAG: DUF501 domain-containing protein [Planctomycetota bacterium]